MAQAQNDTTNRLETEEEEDRGGPFNEQTLTLDEIIETITCNLSDNSYNDLEESLEAMKSTKILIGVLGSPGVGKSSFINNMLGLKSGEEGAAIVGHGGKTKKRKVFSHPFNRQLEFADMPGFGTPKFKKNDAYLREMEIERHDFFLIFFSSTITEEHDWIIRKLRKLKKKFALVRTRADDLDTSSSLSFKECMQEIESTARENLMDFGHKEAVEIFVISNTKPDIGEINELFGFIEKNLPNVKRMTIIIYVHALTDQIIEKKKKFLRERLWKAAGSMGVATGLPVPLIDIPINSVFLEKEIKLYLKTFGLNQEILMKFPAEAVRQLVTTHEIESRGLEDFIKFYIAKAPVILSTAILQEAVEVLIPIFGSLLTGTVAFAYYYNFLMNVLNKLAVDARALRKHHIKSVVDK